MDRKAAILNYLLTLAGETSTWRGLWVILLLGAGYAYTDEDLGTLAAAGVALSAILKVLFRDKSWVAK